MRIALAQVDCDLGDVDRNVRRAVEAVDAARDAGAQLAVFPELHLSGYGLGAVAEDVSLDPTDPRLRQISELAGPMGVLLGFPEACSSGVRTYNSAAYFERGELVHVHRKLYLPTYDIFEERKHFSPGTTLRAFDAEGTRAATLICNDAWQPMLPFLAVQDGARVLLHPANSAQSRFPERYDSPTYWRDLSSFYGRMYQSYVVFVNRVGHEGDLEFFGRSHVADPWGEIVAEAVHGAPDLLLVDLDLDAVRARRREIPLLREARLALLEREIRRLADAGGDL